MKTKSQMNKVSRVQRAQRVSRPRKGIVHVDADHVHSEKYGCAVRREYLADGTPAASNAGGSARLEGAKFLALVKSMAVSYPREVAEPILEGLSRLTPRAIGAIKNLENAAGLLCASDPDFRAVRVMFTAMRLGKSSKSLTSTMTAAVVDAINSNATKAASDAIKVTSHKAEDNNLGCVEVEELARIIAHSAQLGSRLGEHIDSDEGREAVSRFAREVIGELVDAPEAV